MSRSTLFVSIALALALVALAAAAPGPGGWDSLEPGGKGLESTVYTLHADGSTLLAGGVFRDAGGNPDADYIARWDGKAWTALGKPGPVGAVWSIATRGGKVYAGGSFVDAGGNPDADHVAVYDGRAWAPVCKGPPISGTVYALAVSATTLYIGGSFQNAAGIAAADYLVACDLATGAARSLVDSDTDISANVQALALDDRGTLYAGGVFSDFDGIAAADYLAAYDGRAWRALGTGPGSGGGALLGSVRAIAVTGTTVYVGTSSTNVAGIPQAGRVVKWNGSAWSALGSDPTGKKDYFPPATSINALATSGSRLFVGGGWVNASGNPLVDEIAEWDGSAWKAVGSNGAGDGPFEGRFDNGLQGLAVADGTVYAGGNFTSAGGKAANYVASYALAGVPPGGGGGGGGGGTTTTPSGGAAAPPTASATGVVLLDGRPFTTGRVPYNATVDVTRGRLTLRTDTGTLTVNGVGGATAAFVLVRGTDRGRPIVELRLVKGNFGVCPRRRASASRAGTARIVRQLWGSGQGRFRTRGRYASATVRGTRWLTADRCDGTQTRVTQGVVQVNDFRANRQVNVRAGGSYLARP